MPPPKMYAPLPSVEEEEEEEEHLEVEVRSRSRSRQLKAPSETRKSKQRRFLNARKIAYLVEFFIVTTAVVLITLSSVLLVGNSNQRHLHQNSIIEANYQEGEEWRDCGKSVAEAKQAGCVFDLMLNGWVQPECYHRALSEDFIHKGQYRFFSDRQATQEVPLEIVRRGEHTRIYTGPLHHFDHCAYMWRLQARALQTRGPVDSESLDYKHTVHCAGVLEKFYLANTTSFGNESTVGVAFMACGPYRHHYQSAD